MLKSVTIRSVLAAVACSISFCVHAIADEARQIDIPAGMLVPALETLEKQAAIDLVFQPEQLRPFRTKGLRGKYQPDAAIRLLIKGIPLELRTDPATGAMVIVPAAAKTLSLSRGDADPPSNGTVGLSSNLASQDAARETGLEEIVVTAAKREATIQNTPMSITAVSGADIESRGLADFTELAQSVPGVSMRTSGPGQTEFEMRGMTSGGGLTSVVGFYFNDTPLTAATTQQGHVVIDPNLYDLNRVEILRGPQGTLYGSGSMGGTIKIIPNAPNPTALDFSGELILSDTDQGGFNHGENGMINLPFGGGTLALRVVATQDYESGWIDRIVIAQPDFPLETQNLTVRGNVLAAPIAETYKDVNDEDLTSIRASLLWKPNDQLSITPTVFHEMLTQGGPNEIDSNPGTEAHFQPFDTPEPFSDLFNLGSLNVQYKFDAFDVTSTTSHWSRDQRVSQDGAEELQWILSTPTAVLPFYVSQGGIGPTVPASEQNDSARQTSEELRLTSSGDSSLQWLMGYFFSQYKDADNYLIRIPGAVAVFGTSNGVSSTLYSKLTENALFGELNYQLTPKLKATAGLRWYDYDSSDPASPQSGAFPTGSNATVYTTATDAKNSGFNPKFNLSYEFDKDLLLYATAAKGFRPGGALLPLPVTNGVAVSCEASLQALYNTSSFVPSPTGLGPDTVWSYELGEKATLLDGRLTINSAGYYSRWSGVQQTIALPCGFQFLGNAGDAHIYGSEFELNAVLARGLILSANAGYTHSTFVTASIGAAFPPGTPVQDIPNWTSSVSLNYRHGITGQLALTARLENNYVGSRTDATYTVNSLPSYDLTNLRIGVEGQRWKAVLFAKNLFDKEAILSNAPQGLNVAIPTFNRVVVSQPLTIGIDLSYQYGR